MVYCITDLFYLILLLNLLILVMRSAVANKPFTANSSIRFCFKNSFFLFNVIPCFIYLWWLIVIYWSLLSNQLSPFILRGKWLLTRCINLRKLIVFFWPLSSWCTKFRYYDLLLAMMFKFRTIDIISGMKWYIYTFFLL